MTLLRKMQVQGTSDAGNPVDLEATGDGHLETAIHEPASPFGATEIVELLPIFQTDAVYGLNPSQVLATTILAGTATAAGGLFRADTVAGAIGNTGSLQSRRRLRYRPGQGVMARFSTAFTAGVANSVQVAGVGTSEAGFYFGYNGTEFGILYSTGGVREIQTLTITTKSSTVENVTVTLDGVPYLVAVTNGANTQQTAYEISKGTYNGWQAEQIGNTVLFLSGRTGNRTGAFTLAGTTVIGGFVETVAGAANTEVWIPQSTWNLDPCDGSGPSGFNLDPTKGNVYQIGVQASFGAVRFQIEAPTPKNASFITAHIIQFPNTLTTPNVGQPSFPFTMAAANTGPGVAASPVAVTTAEFAGFVTGKRTFTGPRSSYVNNAGVSSTTTTFVPLFSVRNDLRFDARANQAVLNLLSVAGAAKSNQGITTFYLIKNGMLMGAPDFTQFAAGISCTYVDKTATGVTFTDDQLVWSGTVSESGDFIFDFSDDLQLQPGETITLAVRSVTATAVCIGSLNIREDH